MIDLFESSFDRLKLQNILILPEENTQQPMINQQLLQDLDCSDSDDEIMRIDQNDIANIRLTDEGHEKRLVLMSCVGPFLHTYLAVSKTLYLLIENHMMENEFILACVKEITSKVENFECKFGNFSFLFRNKLFVINIYFHFVFNR